MVSIQYVTDAIRELLLHVLVIAHLDRPNALAIAEHITMFSYKKEVVMESGLFARVEKDIAIATGCLPPSYTGIEISQMGNSSKFKTSSYTGY